MLLPGASVLCLCQARSCHLIILQGQVADMTVVKEGLSVHLFSCVGGGTASLSYPFVAHLAFHGVFKILFEGCTRVLFVSPVMLTGTL